jgi:methyl-accepting chemotaxis protein
MTNTRKKTTLQKQFSKSIMGVIASVFLLFLILAIFITYQVTISFTNTLLPMASNGLKQEINAIDFDKFFEEGSVEAMEFEKIKSDISEYKETADLFIGDFSIIVQNDGEYSYLYGVKNGEEISTGEAVGEMDDQVLKAFTSGEEYYSTITNQMIIKKEPIQIVLPILKDDLTVAVISMNVKTDFILNIILCIIGSALLILVIILVIIRIMVSLVARRQTKSIKILVDKMKDLSHLEGDLTKRIQIESNNEIGELADYTNQLLETIQKLMLQIDENAIFLNETSSYFSKVVNDTAAAASSINNAIDDMTSNTLKQTAATNDVGSHINNINESVNQVAINAQSVTEEAIKTSNNAIDGKRAMDDMKTYVGKAVTQVENTGKTVRELDDLSNQINTIVDAITNIAYQTNLLALNASIEAARAGEQGKGFGVVAEEVRILAEESRKQADDITSLIQLVQKSIQNAGVSMDEAVKTMQVENTMVDEIASRFTNIAESIQAVSGMVEEVSSASQEMAAGTSLVTNEIDELSIASKNNAEASNKVASNMIEQNERVEKLAMDIEKIDSIVSELNNLLKDMILE